MPLTQVPNRAPPSFLENGRNWEWLRNQQLDTGDLDLTGLTGDVTVTAAGATAIGTGKVTSGMILDGTIADGDLAANTLSAALPNWGTWYGYPTLGNTTNTAVAADTGYFAQVMVLSKATLTGINYFCVTASGNVRSSLYDSTGARVANRTTNLATSSLVYQKVAFDSTYLAVPGRYFVCLTFSAGATVSVTGTNCPASSVAGPGSGATPTSISVPTTAALQIPTMSTY